MEESVRYLRDSDISLIWRLKMEEDYISSVFVFTGGLRVDIRWYEAGVVHYAVYPAGQSTQMKALVNLSDESTKSILVDCIIKEAEQLHKEGKVNLGMEPYWKTYLRDFM